MRTSLLCLVVILLFPTVLFAQSNSERDAALIRAAAGGELAAVNRLLKEGASVRAIDDRGRTALNAAAYENRVEVVRRLLAANADVNAADQVPSAPLMTASVRGHVEVVRLVLAAGADVRGTNQYGGNALIPACHYGHIEVVRELLKTKIDVDHVNNLGWTALLETIILSDGGPQHREIMQLLIARGANVNIADREGLSPLAHARRRGYGEMVKLLERAGAR